MTCRALVNDTVGALASCAFLDPETAVGLIVGKNRRLYFHTVIFRYWH